MDMSVMDMSDMGGDDSMSGTLSAAGVDLNQTQAADFLDDILDDTVFQVTGNQYARYFWYGVVVVIGIAGLLNIAQKATLEMRIRYAAASRVRPAKPNNSLMRASATITAISREISYPQFNSARTDSWFKIPPFGTILLVATYLGFVLALEFIQNDIPGAQHYTAIGVRASWLAVAQVPLLILLAGKNNLIGLVTGVSYERLNVLHRWAARMLLLLATIHFGSQSYGWNEYGLMQLEWSVDTCPPTGIAAYAILLWLNLSTLAPIRNRFYEFFVVQHLLTFFGFIIAIMIHLPSTAFHSRVYIWIPIGLYLLDRLIRTSRFLYNNVRLSRAVLESMDGGVTKIRIKSQQLKKWSPGSFVLVSIPKSGFGQSHPATIASIPYSHNNDIILILKGHTGFTRRILKSAMSSTTSLLHKAEESAPSPPETHLALLDGPYGGSQNDFAAFDTAILIAASTGVTFTLPIFLDIAYRAASQKLPLCRLEFIWIVKNTTWTTWISDELLAAYKAVRDAGIEVTMRIFVTCDERFTDESEQPAKSGCKCAQSLRPCCCTSIDDGNQSDYVEPARGGQLASETAEKDQSVQVDSARSSLSPDSSGDVNKAYGSLFSAATFKCGRPSFPRLLSDFADQAEGEMGIAVCGPIGLSATVRNTVARLSDQRAVHKGTGAQGIYLHAETFGW